MLLWWCAGGVLLAVAYMVTYTLLRTSGDNRPWFARLRKPNGDGGRGTGLRRRAADDERRAADDERGASGQRAIAKSLDSDRSEPPG